MWFFRKKMPRTPRTLAIGDIHGSYEALAVLIDEIRPTADDTLIFLGDYIDRGSNSRAVLETIIELQEQCNVIALLGNHEAMMRDVFLEKDPILRTQKALYWYGNGGRETLNSYMFEPATLLMEDDISEIFLPIGLEKHLAFIKDLPTYHITDTHIFTHATPYPNKPIEDQSEASLLWRKHGKLDKHFDYQHMSGKVIVSGHTAQKDGLPLILADSNIIIDSGCVWTGWLTAYDIFDNSYIQASINEVRVIVGNAPK